MAAEERIMQGGHIVCPICGESFNWSYKLMVDKGSPLEMMNTTPTYIDSTPHKYMAYVITKEKLVRFSIGCKRCTSMLETDPLELINKTNYLKFSKNL